MEKNGYIESFYDDNNATGKRRTYYRITDAGRAYYHTKCEEWNLTQEVVSKFILREEYQNGNTRSYLKTMFLNLPNTPPGSAGQKRTVADDGGQIHRIERGRQTENEAIGIVISEFEI